MPNFTISPTTGTGSNLGQAIVIKPTAANGTGTDRVTKLYVNGVERCTITHYGIPTATTQDSTNIPSTGGVVAYLVTTHYPVYFEGKPEWITITDGGGNEVNSSELNPIASGTANNSTYYMTVAPNLTTSARTTGNDVFNFRNFMPDGTVDRSHHKSFTISQAAGSQGEEYIVLTPSTVKWDWDEDTGDTKTISVAASAGLTWGASLPAGSDFTIVGSSTGTGDGSITIRPNGTNPWTSAVTRLEATLLVTGSSITANASLAQYAQPQSILYQSPQIDPAGASKTMFVKSDYEWYWNPNANGQGGQGHITMYSGGTAVTIPNSSSIASPVPSGETYSFTWAQNDGNVINLAFDLYYIKLDGTVGTDGYKNYTSQQQQHYSPAPSEDYIVLTPSAGTANSGTSAVYGQVSVSASTDWTVVNNVSWMKWYDARFSGNLVESGVAGETTIYRRVQGNSGGTRTGTATFTAGNASATYTVSQSAATWTASPDSFDDIPAESTGMVDTPKFYLTAPMQWTAQTSYSWIHILYQSMQDREVYFYCDNNSGSARDGSIEIVSGGNTVLMIPVHQLAAE